MNLSESYKSRIQELAGLVSEAKMEDLYDEHFSDVPREDFDKIVNSVPDLAKERNDYKSIRTMSNWMIRLYRKEDLKIEDLYKAKQYLTLLYKNANEMSKEGVSTDLRDYKNLPSLFSVVEKYKKSSKPESVEDEKELISNKYFIDKGEAEKIFEDGRWFVVSPKTLGASKFYGCTSQWCTLFPNMFENYEKQGPLYIIIDKRKLNTNRPERRMQFHFESDQYMDMNDYNVYEDDYYGLDDDDYYHDGPKPGFFYDEFSPRLMRWFAFNKFKYSGHERGTIGLNELKYFSKQEIAKYINGLIERKNFREITFSLLKKLDEDFAREVIKKVWESSDKQILNTSHYDYVDDDVKAQNVDRLINRIEWDIEDSLKSLNTPEKISENLPRSLGHLYQFATKDLSQGLEFKLISGIANLAKKYSKGDSDLYNRIIDNLIQLVNEGHSLSEKAKSFLYKNIDKTESSDSYAYFNKEDRADYFMTQVKNRKLPERQISTARSTLGDEWFYEYIGKKVEKLKELGQPLESLRLSRYELYYLKELSEDEQYNYVNLMFRQPTSPDMDVEKWRALTKDVKAKLLRDVTKDPEKYKNTPLNHSKITELIERAAELDRQDYEDYMRDRYL